VARYAVSFGIALAASLVATLIVRTLARRLKLVAKPRADRWHRKPTALFGGVGIFIGFLVSYLVHRPSELHGDALLVLCGGGMFLLGLVDDFVQLKPYAKLVGQILLATVFTMFGVRLNWLPWQVVDYALTIFWLVGITNALNLLDNLDGLAGGVAAISSAFLVYFCHAGGQTSVALMAAAFCGATLGFLVFNFNPASIFMGDCGSLFLGFMLGGVALVNNQSGLRRNVLAVLTVPVLLLLIPIVDTTLVTFLRKLNGRRVSQGGRDHTSHRLVALGLSERAAALTLWSLAAASGGLAVVVRNFAWPVVALLVPLFGMVIVYFLVFVAGVKVYAPLESAEEGRGRAVLPTLADFGYKRRIFEVLSDVVIIVLAYYASFLLRFDGDLTPYYSHFIRSLPIVIVCQLAAFLVIGQYKGLWRYTSMNDMASFVKCTVGAWLASTLMVVFFYRFEGWSRGVLVMDGVLLFLGVTGTRVAFRVLRSWMLRLKPPANAKRVLIYGAGDGGELLLRELINNRELGLFPVGFVDDDPQKEGRMIHGVKVLGPLDKLQVLASEQKADELVISTGKLEAERSELVSQLCANAGLHCRRMRISLD
jgi:UDP-GlcNAc:undecaprenyl-phosphate/decaprenyl-phosphate GlcNAc-1-phosphate transferase